MKCTICNRRKPSRKCPAKEAPICSRCCGSKRGKEIECPQECGYLSSEQEVLTAKEDVRIDNDAHDDYRRGTTLCLEKDYESAIEVFDGILVRYSKHVPSLIGKANCLLQTYKVEDALELFEGALENDPDSIDAMNGKALCLFVSGHAADALGVLDNALGRAPKDCGLLALKADCLLDIGLSHEAKTVIEDVLKRERENDHALEVLARAQFDLAEFEKAARNLKRAIKIAPEDGRYEFLVNIYFELGKPEEGFETLGHLKGDKATWLDKAEYCHENGFYDYALLCCDSAVEAGEDTVQCNALKARIYLLLEEDSKAEEFADAALGIDPDCIEAIKIKIAGFYAGNEREEALRWIDRVIELNPEDVGIMFLKAKILKHLGREEEFQAVLHEARALIMDFETFWKYGIDLHDMGEYREAVWFLEEALDLREKEALRETLISCHSLLNDTRGMESCLIEAEKAHPDAEWLDISKAVLGFYKDDMALFKESVDGMIDGIDSIDGFDVGRLIPDVNRVSDFFDTAARFFPDNPYILVKNAEVTSETGDMESSLALVDRAISLKKDPLFYVYKVRTQVKMDLLEDALETARGCPDGHIVPVLKGIIFKKMGREEDAKRAYEEYFNAKDIEIEGEGEIIESLAESFKQETIKAMEEWVMGDGEDV